MVKIAPSILAANFENLEEEIKDIEKAGADYIHIDVMDGKFVNNQTPGIEMLKRSKSVANITLDTHLMVENPLELLEDYKESDIITFHIETVNEETANKIIEKLRIENKKIGISIKPATKIESVIPYLDKIDMVLVMLVEPGFGGQKMIKECLEKVRALRSINKEVDIEVDGGVNLENIEEVKEAGANIIVAGTAIFKATDREFVIKQMKL